MNTLDFKDGQTYICTKSDKQWWTVGKEYPVFLDSDNEPAIRDDDGDDWHSSYLNISNNQFKLKEEQPKVTLDEPQKPVVPKFVAEWIEYAKKKGDSLAISFKPWNLYGVEYSKADRWIEDNQETFARAWIDGYEVEKEPKWVVKSNRLYFTGITQLIARDPITYNFTTDEKRAHVFDDKESAEKEASFFDGTVEKVEE